jgi:hypothetical protein
LQNFPELHRVTATNFNFVFEWMQNFTKILIMFFKKVIIFFWGILDTKKQKKNSSYCAILQLLQLWCAYSLSFMPIAHVPPGGDIAGNMYYYPAGSQEFQIHKSPSMNKATEFKNVMKSATANI